MATWDSDALEMLNNKFLYQMLKSQYSEKQLKARDIKPTNLKDDLVYEVMQLDKFASTKLNAHGNPSLSDCKDNASYLELAGVSTFNKLDLIKAIVKECKVKSGGKRKPTEKPDANPAPPKKPKPSSKPKPKPNDDKKKPKPKPDEKEAKSTNSGKRFALVIGNGKYHSSALSSPENDADRMAEKLELLKYEVTKLKNLNRLKMKAAVMALYKKAKKHPGCRVLFYFSGHGSHANAVNFLIPIDDDEKWKAHDIESEGLSLRWIAEQLSQATTFLTTYILDCCRNVSYSDGTKGSANKGLTQLGKKPAGSYFAFACEPGSVAMDGENTTTSLFTKHVLKALDVALKKGQKLDVDHVFRHVASTMADDKLNKRQEKQMPYHEHQLVLVDVNL